MTSPAVADAPKDIRMTLLQTEFISEDDLGRVPAGTVVLVDAKTAERWRRKGIAVDSAITDQTIREAKHAELARLQAEIADIEANGLPPAVPGDRPRRAVAR